MCVHVFVFERFSSFSGTYSLTGFGHVFQRERRRESYHEGTGLGRTDVRQVSAAIRSDESPFIRVSVVVRPEQWVNCAETNGLLELGQNRSAGAVIGQGGLAFSFLNLCFGE